MDRIFTVGVVAVQGAFEEHCSALGKLGVSVKEIRSVSDLSQNIDGLIFPGGESTAQGKLLRESGLFDMILPIIKGGLPVYGTCAGMVLLAKRIENDERKHFAVMDITVKRNAYGRQLGSFVTTGDFGDMGKIPMYFIRAPYISSVGKDVVVLSSESGAITAAREANMLVTSFHPEVTDDLTVHSYFLSMIS
ncbi:MAG: pyridoxal 5'-phosphate synthase glutaminase subunit PdxT [Synergistaceae bacterium]|jgi:5'-phosphate synthase pdxT subunit|nr:pyridoxal 5'-phosphate synthase glutaminase subunit PdxT [Synergistaceae bacterium]MDD2350865.1 pyridoxal 5'-phosphate synthase glutaminase subunit PdxT [Synergistaceae bacterium]MDD3963382.1 pyridoxal 5'-phosphate synthase glutaminase subunit PdxT [Synergistaceae bacterium]MDD4705022.1 pyridoxal 5'-phosphate synthase glutaminase subunit PdxT [Synergistaceae bacterium]MDD5420710.1 pyridoxal 5'-phosphate synthase glutaminase subunit PdxT [Synergistaceae bacterium]